MRAWGRAHDTAAAGHADVPSPAASRPATRARYHRRVTDRPARDPLDDFAWHPDPELVWYVDPARSRESVEALGAAAWEVALDWLYEEGFRRPTDPMGYGELRRLWYGMPSDAPASSVGPGPAPSDPSPASAVLDEFRARLSEHQLSSVHPLSWSYFTPPPLLLSVVGELLAQVIDQGVDVWRAAPTGAFVEEETVRWLCDLVGYGPDGFGVLTSGGVMANIMAMTVARDIHLSRLVAGQPGHDDGVRAGGEALPDPPRASALAGVRLYASDQAHFSIARAVDILGFPPETLRIVPSDGGFRLQADPVAAAVAEDRRSGLRPFAIAAVAGSTNTGSVDDVAGLADLAAAEDLWLHVDAAYGGGALLSERDAGRIGPLGRADSVTIDPHKWFFQPYDVGALLVRRRDDLRDTFHREPEYYRTPGNGEEPLNFYQLSMEGSRRLRALKLWMSWKHLGTRGLGRLVERNDDLAARLAALVARSDDFEATPPEPDLSVVCFRWLPGGRTAAAGLDRTTLDEVQDRLQRALEVSGEGWVSTTRLRGATWLRAGIVNYLSTDEDADRMLTILRRLGPGVAEGMGL
jgi:glutamate/tyrosine decarboxylase-like PLP-dependent enzyme